MSCGPFHCAAVSLDGALFTWGEGFGGKLGHGNQNCQEQPTLVEALVGRQVRGLVCGPNGVCHPLRSVRLDGGMTLGAQSGGCRPFEAVAWRVDPQDGSKSCKDPFVGPYRC